MSLQPSLGLRISLSGANFAGSGLTSTDYLALLKSLGSLKGLYLFNDAIPGANYTTAIDLSGNGSNAIARTTGGYQTPVGNAAGVLISAGSSVANSGGIFDTPVPVDNTLGFTRIWAGKQLVVSSAPPANADCGAFALTGASLAFPSNPGAIPAAYNGVTLSQVLFGSSVSFNPYGLWAIDPESASITNGTILLGGVPNTFGYNVFSHRMNLPALTTSLDAQGPVSGVHNLALNAAAATQTFVANHSFGFTAGIQVSSTYFATGIVSAFAVYDGALSDANNASAVAAIRAILNLRPGIGTF